MTPAEEQVEKKGKKRWANSKPLKVRLRSVVFGADVESDFRAIVVVLYFAVALMYVSVVFFSSSKRCKRINTRVFLHFHFLPSNHQTIP